MVLADHKENKNLTFLTLQNMYALGMGFMNERTCEEITERL